MNHTNAQIRAEVEKAEARFAETYPDTPRSGGGRRATIRSMALQHVAEKLDIPLNTVCTKYRRAATNPRPPTKREREHFELLGVDVSESYRAMLGRVLSGVQGCLRHLASAKSAIASVAATQPFPEPKLKQFLGEFDALYQRAKGLTPVGICPWCKNTKTYRDKCVSCFGTGYMMRHQQHAVPARLKEPGVIIQNGHELRSSKLAQADDPENTGKTDAQEPAQKPAENSGCTPETPSKPRAPEAEDPLPW